VRPDDHNLDSNKSRVAVEVWSKSILPKRKFWDEGLGNESQGLPHYSIFKEMLF